jgi:hypothetical protein
MPDRSTLALRAYVEPLNAQKKVTRAPRRRRAHFVLFVDTETTTDRSQQLNFGFYRYCRVGYALGTVAATCVEEGLLYADDLPMRYPEGFELLEEFVRHEAADVSGARRDIRFFNRTEFADQVLRHAALRVRAQLCFFNAPFDISRLAVDSGEARGSFQGGFSFVVWTYRDQRGRIREHTFRPRIAVRSLDGRRALIGFTAGRRGDDEPPGIKKKTFRGHFLDLRTLVYALTNESHSLASACRAFGIQDGKLEATVHGRITADYIRYARQDVKALSRLYERVIAEFERHPIGLQETKAFSPASIGKAYLRSLGVLPRGGR